MIRAGLVGACALMSLLGAHTAQAAPDVDTTYGGGDGVATTDVPGYGVDAVVVDGEKLMVLGATSSPRYGGGATGRFGVVRFTEAGALDAEFGGGDGVLEFDVPGCSSAAGTAISSPAADGDVYVVGDARCGLPQDGTRVAVARVNSDGTLDGGFSGDGIAVADFGTSIFSTGIATHIRAGDAGAVVIGQNWESTALLRFASDGTIDTGFAAADGDGTDGVALGGFGAGPTKWVTFYGVRSDPGTGEILVTGGTGVVVSEVEDWLVARFTPDGAPDITWGGGDGSVEAERSGYGSAYDIVIDAPRNRYLATGTTDAGYSAGVLSVNATDGTINTGFGFGGMSTTYFSGQRPALWQTVSVQPDGSLWLGGGSERRRQQLDDRRLRVGRRQARRALRVLQRGDRASVAGCRVWRLGRDDAACVREVRLGRLVLHPGRRVHRRGVADPGGGGDGDSDRPRRRWLGRRWLRRRGSAGPGGSTGPGGASGAPALATDGRDPKVTVRKTAKMPKLKPFADVGKAEQKVRAAFAKAGIAVTTKIVQGDSGDFGYGRDAQAKARLESLFRKGTTGALIAQSPKAGKKVTAATVKVTLTEFSQAKELARERRSGCQLAGASAADATPVFLGRYVGEAEAIAKNIGCTIDSWKFVPSASDDIEVVRAQGKKGSRALVLTGTQPKKATDLLLVLREAPEDLNERSLTIGDDWRLTAAKPENRFSVQVVETRTGRFVKGAKVAAWYRGEEIDTATTDRYGDAALALDTPRAGKVLLTVSAAAGADTQIDGARELSVVTRGKTLTTPTQRVLTESGGNWSGDKAALDKVRTLPVVPGNFGTAAAGPATRAAATKTITATATVPLPSKTVTFSGDQKGVGIGGNQLVGSAQGRILFAGSAAPVQARTAVAARAPSARAAQALNPLALVSTIAVDAAKGLRDQLEEVFLSCAVYCPPARQDEIIAIFPRFKNRVEELCLATGIDCRTPPAVTAPGLAGFLDVAQTGLAVAGSGIRAVAGVEVIAGHQNAGMTLSQLQAMAAKLVGPDGSSLIGADGSSLIGPDGSSIVAAGAGNLVGPGGSSLIGADGSSLIGKANPLMGLDALRLVAAGGGNMVAAGAGNLVAAGAGNLVAAGGGNIVAAGAGNMVAAGAGNMVAAGAGNLIVQGGAPIVQRF